MVNPENGVLGGASAGAGAQEHVESHRIIPAEHLSLGEDIHTGCAAGGVVVFIDLQIQPEGALVSGAGCRRDGQFRVIDGERRGVILDTVYGAELQIPVGTGVGVEIIGKEDFLLRVVVVPDGGRGTAGIADGVSRARDHGEFDGFIPLHFVVIEGVHLDNGLGLEGEDF